MKTGIARLLGVFRVPNGNPELTLAQYEAFSKQVPLLYFILSTNLISLSWTHQGVAPDYLVRYIPGLLVLAFALRGIIWFTRRKMRVTAEQAFHKLKATNRLAIPIAVVCTGWALAVFPYGNAYHQAHVAFFMAITVIGCIFCLMHLRSAALMVTILVNFPFFVFMVWTGEPTFIATGVNVILVCMAMVMILLTHYRDFRQLHETSQVLMLQQTALQEQNKAMQALSDENLRLANLDSLTMLANRRCFFQSLDIQFERARKSGTQLAIGVIDLDGFKPINDMFGHAAGDKVLVEVGERLSRMATGDLSVYRLGGDEFALILSGEVTETSVLSLGAAACEAIAERINAGSAVVQVTGSIGFAIYPDVGANGQELYERADYALYAAKRNQRAGAVIFTAVQASELSRQKTVEEALLAADLETELQLVFQPIIDIALDKTVGYEALVRWHNPSLGLVSPGEFIPIAEHTGRIGLITRLVLKQALEVAKTWPDDIYLSCNLSPHDITTPDYALRIVSTVMSSGFNPRRINFEITETAVMHDFDQAIISIQLLRDIGAGVSLDDFGTGYSSLNHVHKLPLTKIKIDSSFVRDIHILPSSFQIVKSVLALSAEMGLEAIVEGVETAEELAVLKDLGVRSVQGFYFARPVPASETIGTQSVERQQIRA